MIRNLVPLVAIVDANEIDLAETRRMLVDTGRVEVVGTARGFAEMGQLLASEPDLILLDAAGSYESLVSGIQYVHEHLPRCQVILTAPRDAQVDLSKAMRAGARGFLRKPIAPAELVESIQEIFNIEQHRLSRIEEVAKLRATEGKAGVVIYVYSPKGGAGATTLATNLAIALGKVSQGQIALVDFDLQFGDVNIMLNLRSTHGVHELVRNLDDLDNAILNDVMAHHQPTGVRVLLPPPNLEQVEDIDSDSLATVVKAMRRYYDFVVIDSFHSVEETTLALINAANVVLLVTAPEIHTLRSTRRFLDYLGEQQDAMPKVRVVLNRFPSKSGLTMKDIEGSLNMQPIASIPDDPRTVLASINEGVPFVQQDSPATRSIMQLATMLARPRIERRQNAANTRRQGRFGLKRSRTSA